MPIQRRVISIVRPDGSTNVIKMTPVMEMEYERRHKTSITKLDQGDGAANNLAHMAYIAEEIQHRKAGDPPLEPFSKWIEGVEVIDLDAVDVKPTQADQGAES